MYSNHTVIFIYRYNVFIIEDPYVTYKINVTVQQLDYQLIATGNKDKRDIWKTIGYAEIGPQRIGQNTANNQKGTTSGPKVCWHKKRQFKLQLMCFQCWKFSHEYNEIHFVV